MLRRIYMWVQSPLPLTKGWVVLFGALVFALLITNVALLIQNRNLKTANADPPKSRDISVGTHLPTLAGLSPDGKELTFDNENEGRKVVLLFFSPNCGLCASNMPNWKRIIGGLDRKSHSVIAVSAGPSGVAEYAAQYGLNDIPVIASMHPRTKSAFEMKGVPQTVLIDQYGRVEKVWKGIITDDDWKDIESVLKFTLEPVSKN